MTGKIVKDHDDLILWPGEKNEFVKSGTHL